MSFILSETHQSWSTGIKDEFVNYTAYQDDKQNRIILFDTPEELIRCVKENMKCFGGSGKWTDESHVQKKGQDVDQWRFGNELKTHEATAHALEFGMVPERWLERVEDSRDQLLRDFPELDRIAEVAMTKRRRRVFNDTDGELEIDRYMTNDPVMFSHMKKTDVRARTATIYIAIDVSGYTSAETITTSMVQCGAIIDIIQRGGLATEVIIGFTGTRSQTDCRTFSVCVYAKQAFEPLDLSKLISFASPGFFRQYCFALISNVHSRQGSAASGLGSPTRERDQMPAKFFDANVVVSSLDDLLSKDVMRLIIKDIEELYSIKNEYAPAHE